MLMLWAQNPRNSKHYDVPHHLKLVSMQTRAARDIYGNTALQLYVANHTEAFTEYFKEIDLIPKGLQYPGWRYDTNDEGNTPVQTYIKYCQMSYATTKIFKYLSYNQLSGAPEDWRLHRNKNG